MISFSSVVILAWRERLYVSVSLSSISAEFFVELSIACAPASSQARCSHARQPIE